MVYEDIDGFSDNLSFPNSEKFEKAWYFKISFSTNNCIYEILSDENFELIYQVIRKFFENNRRFLDNTSFEIYHKFQEAWCFITFLKNELI